MCEPVSITMAIVSAAGVLANVVATNSSAEDQFAAAHEQAENQMEENRAGAEENLGARLKEMRRVRARARVAGGESGAQGQSFAVGLNQMVQDQNMATAIVAKNVALGARSTNSQLKLANSNVRTVSGLSAGLQIATAGASGYMTGSAIKSTLKKRTIPTKD